MDTTYAYLAGAIDADGFISVSKKTGYRRRADGSSPTYYSVRIGLSETRAEIPDLLQATWPAWRGEHQPKNPAHKRWHIWQTMGAKAREPLTRLLPYLILKREQARLALEFLDLVESQRSTFKGVPLSGQYETERRRLYEAITHLNSPRNRRVHFVASA